MPGVEAVLTADSPGARIPWFPGANGPTSWLFDPICRHEGDEVAAVAARTRKQAETAARAVEVEFEELPFVVDQAAALLRFGRTGRLICLCFSHDPSLRLVAVGGAAGAKPAGAREP